MLFLRSTENEWNISHNFTTARVITYQYHGTQRRRYITFFTLVGDSSRRQVCVQLGSVPIGGIKLRQKDQLYSYTVKLIYFRPCWSSSGVWEYDERGKSEAHALTGVH